MKDLQNLRDDDAYAERRLELAKFFLAAQIVKYGESSAEPDTALKSADALLARWKETNP